MSLTTQKYLISLGALLMGMSYPLISYAGSKEGPAALKIYVNHSVTHNGSATLTGKAWLTSGPNSGFSNSWTERHINHDNRVFNVTTLTGDGVQHRGTISIDQHCQANFMVATWMAEGSTFISMDPKPWIDFVSGSHKCVLRKAEVQDDDGKVFAFVIDVTN